MSSSFIGEIRPFAFNWHPEGWLLCDGHTYTAQQYPALFSILGRTFGGDGQTNFAVPNLIAAIAMGQGQGTGLTPRVLGTFTGNEAAHASLPNHTHGLNFIGPGYSKAPTAFKAGPTANTSYPSRFNDITSTTAPVSYLAFSPTPPTPPATATPSNPVGMNPSTVSAMGSGNGANHENRQPYLALGFYICATDGVYPPFP